MKILEMRPHHLAATLAIIEDLDCNPGLDMDWLCHRTIDDSTCSSDLLLLAEVGDEIVGFCFGCVRGERDALVHAAFPRSLLEA